MREELRRELSADERAAMTDPDLRKRVNVARSTLPLSAIGAWLDFAQSSTTTDPDFAVPCNNFSFGTCGTYNAASALPTGPTGTTPHTLPTRHPPPPRAV